ncbi:MAG: HAD family hydrolase [Clostridia bacterium]|nr:HAD family hydrolase [Clostridia bacterium]
MPQKGLYIFDFDGTISYTGDDIALSLNEVRKAHGLVPLETKEVLRFVGYGAKYLIDNTLNVPGASPEDILNEYKKAYYSHCTDTSRPYEGLDETLDRIIEEGGTVSMFTNKPLNITLKMLDFFGVRDRFHSIFCPENLVKRKPDPEGIFRCMEEANRSKRDTVMIGDSKADIDAGRAAGVKTCACLYGVGDREKLLEAGPDLRISDIREITDLKI